MALIQVRGASARVVWLPGLAEVRWVAACAMLLGTMAFQLPSAGAASGSVERGAYLFTIAGCVSCHTVFDGHEPRGGLLAGGRALKTPVGVFYGPNITPDPVYGIGGWSDADFIKALREGIRPDGAHLFPTFPYTSFTLITDADLVDIKAYIFSLPPVGRASKEHDVDFPFSWRWLQTFWRWFNFTRGPFREDSTKSAAWNRGAYIVQALAHCAECHTPRNMMGGLETDLAYSGTTNGPDGLTVPNITQDAETGIGRWTHQQIVRFLRKGFLPNGDVAGSLMTEVIERETSKMTDSDREAVAMYLEAIPPVRNTSAKAIQPGTN